MVYLLTVVVQEPERDFSEMLHSTHSPMTLPVPQGADTEHLPIPDDRSVLDPSFPAELGVGVQKC